MDAFNSVATFFLGVPPEGYEAIFYVFRAAMGLILFDAIFDVFRYAKKLLGM